MDIALVLEELGRDDEEYNPACFDETGELVNPVLWRGSSAPPTATEMLDKWDEIKDDVARIPIIEKAAIVLRLTDHKLNSDYRHGGDVPKWKTYRLEMMQVLDDDWAGPNWPVPPFNVDKYPSGAIK